MNILPKKNWHVRKKENIARVRRDEAEALEKEKEQIRRKKLAEQEARIALLRHRARNNVGDDPCEAYTNNVAKDDIVSTDIYTSSGNINFFKDIEAGVVKTGTNKGYEEDKKQEKEAYEKKIGLLNYLIQDPLEATGKSNWYNDKCHIVSTSRTEAGESAIEVSIKSKIKLDPLNDILLHSNSKPSVASKVKQATLSFSAEKGKETYQTFKKHRRSKVKKKKRKLSESDDDTKRKIKKKRFKTSKKCRSSSEDDDDEHCKQLKLAELRKERLKREAVEKKRQEALIAELNPAKNLNDSSASAKCPSFKQKYNSQFNPHLARQNQTSNDTISSLKPGVKYWML